MILWLGLRLRFPGGPHKLANFDLPSTNNYRHFGLDCGRDLQPNKSKRSWNLESPRIPLSPVMCIYNQAKTIANTKVKNDLKWITSCFHHETETCRVPEQKSIYENFCWVNAKTVVSSPSSLYFLPLKFTLSFRLVSFWFHFHFLHNHLTSLKWRVNENCAWRLPQKIVLVACC